jgi:hypothetical protein
VERPKVKTLLRVAIVAFAAAFQVQALAGSGDSTWMLRAKYGIFLHYQYRILLGYSIKTKPQFPTPSQMTAAEWNRFVGLDQHLQQSGWRMHA